MSKTRIIAFPGFLGDQSDWGFWKPFLPDSYFLETHLVSPLENECTWDWCARFLRDDLHQEPSFLVGYSLGGRVAAQLLIAAPLRFKGLIAISTHPGLGTIKEKEDRISSDQTWANRFALQSKEDWNRILDDWDSQAVFQAPQNLNHNGNARRESIALRIRSQRQLLQIGLGTQPDLRRPLLESNVPQIWATGAFDQKFSSLALAFSDFADRTFHSPKHKIGFHSVDSGHRFPWTLSPVESAKLLNQWIGELDEKISQ